MRPGPYRSFRARSFDDPRAAGRVATVTHVRTVAATRYVTPFREGGSLPALVEADDDGLYVLKFRGAGQGRKALVAEVVAGELARALGLPVPELVLAELDPAIGRAEPDPEIQDLLLASAGTNLGVDFPPGALPFSPAAGPDPDPDFAADVVWLDALVTNVDRTPQNPNLLWWHRRLWLIDHGAALYWHHAPSHPLDHERGRFEPIRDHVLLPYASSIAAADERLAARVTPALIDEVVAAVPAEWLDGEDAGMYARYLTRRLEPPRAFVEEAEHRRR
jgi:HipA-like kinase